MERVGEKFKLTSPPPHLPTPSPRCARVMRLGEWWESERVGAEQRASRSAELAGGVRTANGWRVGEACQGFTVLLPGDCRLLVLWSGNDSAATSPFAKCRPGVRPHSAPIWRLGVAY